MQPDRQLWTYLWDTVHCPVPTAKSAKSAMSRYTMKRSTSSQLRGAEWISGVVLGLWDNVAGPRTEHVWNGFGEAVDEPGPELLHDITRDTLAGTLESKLLSKFVVLPHVGTVVSSVVFEAPHKDAVVKFVLALFARRSHLGRIVTIYPVIEDKLMYLALLARSLYAKGAEGAADTLSPEVERAVQSLDTVFGVPPPLLPASQRPSPETNVAHARSLYTAAKVLGLDLLARSVTSHMQTRGYTVVVGSDEAVVNTLVEALALFMDERERSMSSKAAPGRTYCADLVLQGVTPRHAVTQEQLILAPAPTTVIDLGASRPVVYQPRSYPEYANTRRNYFREVLARAGPQMASASASPAVSNSTSPPPNATPPPVPIRIMVNSASPPPQSLSAPPGTPGALAAPVVQAPGSWLPKEGMLVAMSRPSPMVVDMLYQALRLPEPLRMSFLNHSCKRIASKAVTLLKLLTHVIKQQPVLAESSWKWLKDNLNLQEDSDLNVLMAYADRLSPGLCQSISTDRLTLEEKFVELFDGFV